MPALVQAIAWLATGAWLGSQVDDGIETVTGEKAGISPLTLALIGLAIWVVYAKVIKR